MRGGDTTVNYAPGAIVVNNPTDNIDIVEAMQRADRERRERRTGGWEGSRS